MGKKAIVLMFILAFALVGCHKDKDDEPSVQPIPLETVVPTEANAGLADGGQERETAAAVIVDEQPMATALDEYGTGTIQPGTDAPQTSIEPDVYTEAETDTASDPGASPEEIADGGTGTEEAASTKTMDAPSDEAFPDGYEVTADGQGENIPAETEAYIEESNPSGTEVSSDESAYEEGTPYMEASSGEPKSGDVLEDGSIYLGEGYFPSALESTESDEELLRRFIEANGG